MSEQEGSEQGQREVTRRSALREFVRTLAGALARAPGEQDEPVSGPPEGEPHVHREPG